MVIAIRVTLESIATVLVLYGILGFKIKKDTLHKVYGVTGIILTAVMMVVMHRTILGFSTDIWWITVGILSVSLFGVRKIGAVAAAVMAVDSLQALADGVLTILLCDKDNYFDLITVTATLGSAICVIIAGVIIIIINETKTALRNYADSINQFNYVAVAAVSYILTYTFWWSNPQDDDYIFVEGSRLIVNGFGRIVFTFAAMLYFEVVLKGKELKKQIGFNQKCIEEQTEQYEFLNATQQELRKFRHDSIAHLTAIEYMAANNETDKIKGYVNKLLGEYDKTKYISTGNVIGDAVVNQCYRRCKESGVNISVIGSFGAEMKMDETDLCIILTNILSNAYEAAIKCERRTVRIEMSSFEETQFIRATNSTLESTITSDGELCISESSKEDKSSHGFGIQNIKDAVKRCGGKVRWDRIDENGCPMIMTEVELPVRQ
jgi:hypothetical protein